MSIAIDTNLDYIMQKLRIDPVKFEELYANSGVEDIIEAEAAEGNPQAIALANELLTNPNLLIELFALADPNNKHAILKELTAAQMAILIPQMEKKDMLQGLNFFTQDKLMKMLQELPPDQLVKTVFQMFSKEQVIQLMPEEQLNKFLADSDIDKNKMMKHLMSIPPEYLAQMLENITGEAAQGNSYDIVKQIGNLNPLEYKEALFSMQPIQKQQLVLSLGKEHPEWFEKFDSRAYTHIIETQKQKPDVVKAMGVIKPEHIVNMLKELPNDLLSIVLTQIDTAVFAENLMKRFPEKIAEFILK